MGTITAVNLGKAYKQYPSRWSRVAEWLHPRGPVRHQLHWVLKDVNFSIRAGEAVGIVGVNGAGKSTLLKIITGTTQANAGVVQTAGSVSALLELGMGFHPDFTGRQNALMAGQLLGMQPEEIIKLMPEIEAFASIGEYIDQPVRVYSSGMQVRLAFAVATCKRPDILIVDEALSVGDAAFQRKCFQRIESFRAAGTTLLLVTHDVETVKKICDRALFIKEGTLFQIGSAKQVCDEYERYLFGDPKKSRLQKQSAPDQNEKSAFYDPNLVASCAMTYGSGAATIFNVRLEDEEGNRVNVSQTGTDIALVFDVEIGNVEISAPCVNMQVNTADGVVVYGVNTDHINRDELALDSLKKYRVEFRLENRLAPGTYFLTCGIKEGGIASDTFCCRVVDAGVLKVVDRDFSTVARGIVDLRGKFAISEQS
jgi:lipopolysaccharide transport system ATP-binding protein